MTDQTPDETREKLYSELKVELYKRQLSNSENFDKSVLTYAVAGLGLSLGFLKDFIPITSAAFGWLLYMSWALFVFAVVLTMISFDLSQRGVKKQLELARRYYLEFDDSALGETNRFSRFTELVNFWSGISFVVALIFTTVFVAINLERAAAVKDKKPEVAPLGALIPDLQRIAQPDVVRGAPLPDIRPVPTPPSPAPVQIPNIPPAPANNK